MKEILSKLTIRIIMATLFLVVFNTVGVRYGWAIPINFFSIIVIAAFGIPGVIAAILLIQGF